MKKKSMDIISGAALILFAVWGWYETSIWKESAASSGISVKVYPRAVFTGLGICGAIILIRTLIKLVRGKDLSLSELSAIIEMHPVKVLITIVLMLLYIFALRAFGFLFTTPVFLYLSMLLFGERRWARMAIISIAGTAVLYLFFVVLMNVRF
ncbi:MAG: tripartite tricarboxylate transporter TctB family protein [Oscillospiraceae bacterium]|nr:tripartite tricarboxylate transporter TctB family protein [Oscillospiraceae bacterium]